MIPAWPEIQMIISREAIVPNDGTIWGNYEGFVSLFQCDTAAIRGATHRFGGNIATIYIFPLGWAKYTDEDLKFKAELMIRYRLKTLTRCYVMNEVTYADLPR